MKETLHTTVLKVLRPLVRILLRNGVPFGTFAEAARWVYVDLALKEFSIEGRKATDSRAAIVTGLTRKEIHRLRNLEIARQQDSVAKYNRAARVISGWVRDRRFADVKGRPLDLPLEQGEVTFADLVKQLSGDVPPRAVLDELLRVGAVALTEDGKVQLLARAYVPHQGELEKLSILGTDVADLITTIDTNLQGAEGAPRFQRKVAYDNVPVEAVGRFREISAAGGQRLLECLDRYLSEHDRDLNAGVEGTGRRRVGLGIYYFEEDLDQGPGGGEEKGS
jgi:Family of unknown function (DUF6502)